MKAPITITVCRGQRISHETLRILAKVLSAAFKKEKSGN
jgi:hypothetical protein